MTVTHSHTDYGINQCVCGDAKTRPCDGVVQQENVTRPQIIDARRRPHYFFAAALLVVVTFLQSADAYPAFMMLSARGEDAVGLPPHSGPELFLTQSSAESARPLNAKKRAFDRLDVSPFDFEALSKRFNDDDDLFYGRRRRAFDRLDDNAFLGLMSRKRRAFDRLEDAPFMMGKRAADYDSQRVAKRPFDRLDGSAFGIAKRRVAGMRMSIADLLQRLENYDVDN